MEAAVLPLIADFNPDALVVQCGADALDDDPMSRLALSNVGLWRVIDLVADTAPRLLVLGGGGYNPWSVARCWAGVWAILNGFAIPDRLPPAAEGLLRDVVWPQRSHRSPNPAWFTTLADPERPSPLREEVRLLARTVLSTTPATASTTVSPWQGRTRQKGGSGRAQGRA